jgi:uncharacterized protein
MSVEDLAKHLEQAAGAKSSPPVHLWRPPISGVIDIRIDREGVWFHDGSQIKREALVKLFASVLWEEGGEHYLVTPVEKWRIQVDVAPLLVVRAERQGRGQASEIQLYTHTGDTFPLDRQHPLQVLADAEGNPLPLVHVRYTLMALIHRNVFYQLADWSETAATGAVGIWSGGEFFELHAGDGSA